MTERDFKGIWIPKEILALGLIEISKWVSTEFKINLLAENPMEGE